MYLVYDNGEHKGNQFHVFCSWILFCFNVVTINIGNWKTHLKIFQIYANNEDHHVLVLNLIGFWFGVIFRM